MQLNGAAGVPHLLQITFNPKEYKTKCETQKAFPPISGRKASFFFVSSESLGAGCPLSHSNGVLSEPESPPPVSVLPVSVLELPPVSVLPPVSSVSLSAEVTCFTTLPLRS